MEQRWRGKTGGTAGMQRMLKNVMRFLPLELMYVAVSLIVPFYMLFNHREYLASYHYFKNRLGYGKVKSFFHVYMNHFMFGKIVLDRFAAFGGKRYQINADHMELYDELSSSDKGFIVLSAHIGCFEIAGCMLTSHEKQFNAIVYDKESTTISNSREKRMSGHNMKMIPLKKDMSHLFAINAAIDRGEIVSMSADRTNGSQKTLKCIFMGAEAHFPCGPFSLANIKNIPMLAVFVMKTGVRRYNIHISKVRNAQHFVLCIESVLKKYPLQWFNYYEFWEES